MPVRVPVPEHAPGPAPTGTRRIVVRLMLYEVDIVGARTSRAAMPALAFDFLCSVFKKHQLGAHTASTRLEVRSYPLAGSHRLQPEQPAPSPGFRGGFPEYPAWRMMSSSRRRTRHLIRGAGQATRCHRYRTPGRSQPAQSHRAWPPLAQAGQVAEARAVSPGDASTARRRSASNAPMAVHGETPGPVGGDRDADPAGDQRVGRAAATPSSASHTPAPAAVQIGAVVRSGRSRGPGTAGPAPGTGPGRPGGAGCASGPGASAPGRRPAPGPAAAPPGPRPAGPQTTLAHQCTP